MVARWLPENSTTLEVGARYGSVSCAIAQKQKQSGKQVSVDADHRVWESLEKNRVSHNCSFHTVRGLLAKQDGRIFEDGFGTVAAPGSVDEVGHAKLRGSVTVPHFTLEEVEKEYGLKFDAANFDCEGCAAFLLKDFPILKTQLQLIILEQHDDGEANATADLLTNGWVMVDHASRQRVLVNTAKQGQTPGSAHILSLHDELVARVLPQTARRGAVIRDQNLTREPQRVVQWTFETEACPIGSMGLSCVDICAGKRLSCDQRAFKSLNSEAAVRAAYAAAGHNCTKMESYAIASYWEGPVSSSGVCLFNSHPSGFGLCEGSSACDFRRICPCV